MIPRDLIEKAVAAAEANWAPPDDWQHEKTYSQVSAALYAVYNDIAAPAYDEGYEEGPYDRAFGYEYDNPYRSSEQS